MNVVQRRKIAAKKQAGRTKPAAKALGAPSFKARRHSKEMRDIISQIAGWAGGEEQALAWFSTQPISAFGDQTAEAMVKAGKASAVRDYLDGIALGGFA